MFPGLEIRKVEASDVNISRGAGVYLAKNVLLLHSI